MKFIVRILVLHNLPQWVIGMQYVKATISKK